MAALNFRDFHRSMLRTGTNLVFSSTQYGYGPDNL